MRKFLLTIAFLGGISLVASAQERGKLSIGIDAGALVGDASNVSSIAIGGSLKYDHPIAQQLFFSLSGGYTYLPYKNDVKVASLGYGVNQSGEGFIPLKAGIKYMFNDMFYGEGQVGAAISTESGGGTAFAYAPGVGLKFANAVDLGVRYEGWSKNRGTISQFALRLAYQF
ncbi:outer membrane beta-barrel protein [Mucilaginibacter antarcticus]|uniref:Outer membrane beta-barrel protein n=1 Tax=Mucilaginibacter antarcticus TaxID=1855725 RepID=A0ABW5XSC9_9SPHI